MLINFEGNCFHYCDAESLFTFDANLITLSLSRCWQSPAEVISDSDVSHSTTNSAIPPSPSSPPLTLHWLLGLYHYQLFYTERHFYNDSGASTQEQLLSVI